MKKLTVEDVEVMFNKLEVNDVWTEKSKDIVTEIVRKNSLSKEELFEFLGDSNKVAESLNKSVDYINYENNHGIQVCKNVLLSAFAA